MVEGAAMAATVREGLMASMEPGGFVTLTLKPPLGEGAMRLLPICPGFLAATVDFACERCPNVDEMASAPGLGLAGAGRWMSVNLCLAGRCEVSIPRQGYAVVKAGDCCVSCSNERPEDYRYPLGKYRGVELFLHTALECEGALSWYREAGGSLEELARDAGLAAVFSGDTALNGPLARIGEALEAYRQAIEQGAPPGEDIAVRCKYELLGLLLALRSRDVAQAQPRAFLTPHQLAVARSVRDELERSLAEAHDARIIAARYGLAATTLNRYFDDLYGTTVAAYVRHRRMEEAAKLIARGALVADAAVTVGYSNPSKFAAAFKREIGQTPTEYRRAWQLAEASRGRQ